MTTVKALQWEELSERCWDADGMGKLYRVMKREDGTAKLKHGVYDHGTEYPSIEAAKSAAFEDYSARIMSAIEPAGVGVEKALKAVMEAIVSCGHEIDHDAVVLKFSERQKGHNAYNQLNTRVRNALAKALATEEGKDNG